MSSNFHAICTSHDPALMIQEPEFHSSNYGREAIEGVLINGVIEGHEECDLVGGRWSGGLIEVYRPPHKGESKGEWISKEWLQALYQVYKHDLPHSWRLEHDWSPWIVERLRFVIGSESNE